MAQGPRLGALTPLYVCAWPLSTGPCGHAHWPGRGLGVRPDSLSPWLWARYLVSLCLSFPLCKTRIIIVPTSGSCIK